MNVHYYTNDRHGLGVTTVKEGSDDEIGQVTGGAGRQQTEYELSGHIRSDSSSDENYALAAG